MTSSATMGALDVTPAGTFEVDPAHSRLGFAVRHMMTPVHGQFLRFSGHGVIAGSDLGGSSVQVTVEAASIETHQGDRDAHLRSADFFDVEAHPTIIFRSTAARRLDGDRVAVTGDLTIKGITRPVDLEFTYRRRASARCSAQAAAWVGTNTIPTSSAARRRSSGPPTRPTWCRTGCPRWTAWWTSWPSVAPSPTSGAGTEPRRYCSPRSSRARRSWVRTTTPSRSRSHASGLPRRGWPNRRRSRWRRHRPSPTPGSYVTGWVLLASFEVASAQTFTGTGYDLVTTFDALHDMGDPLGAARHVLQALTADGTWLIVEPFAGDSVTDNLNPVGRMYYSFSTFLCVPNGKSQPGGYALGAQAGRDPACRAGRRLHPFPAGRADTVQPGVRGASVAG